MIDQKGARVLAVSFMSVFMVSCVSIGNTLHTWTAEKIRERIPGSIRTPERQSKEAKSLSIVFKGEGSLPTINTNLLGGKIYYYPIGAALEQTFQDVFYRVYQPPTGSPRDHTLSIEVLSASLEATSPDASPRAAVFKLTVLGRLKSPSGLIAKTFTKTATAASSFDGRNLPEAVYKAGFEIAKNMLKNVRSTLSEGGYGYLARVDASYRRKRYKRPVTAVFPLDCARGLEESARDCYDSLLSTLVGVRAKDGSDLFDVVERNEIDQIIKEQKLNRRDLFDATRAAKAGYLLGARLVVIGRLSKPENKYKLSIRFVDVETGKIIAAGMLRLASTLELLEDGIKELIQRMLEDR